MLPTYCYSNNFTSFPLPFPFPPHFLPFFRSLLPFPLSLTLTFTLTSDLQRRPRPPDLKAGRPQSERLYLRLGVRAETPEEQGM